MGFDVTDDDIHAEGLLLAGGLEHGVGLAHTRGHAEKDLQLAPLPLVLLPLDGFQQLVGVGSLIVVHGIRLTR